MNLRKRHRNAFYLAIGFFTRLPTRFLSEITDEDMGRALIYMPIVGLLVGLCSVGVGLSLIALLEYWHGHLSVLHIVLSGAVCFVSLLMVSGGLHLDGLADCADAWVGGLGDRERTLDILKDPRCGAVAVTTLIATLIAKAAGVIGLVMTENWLLLLFIPVASRCSALALFLTTHYVRPKGLGQNFSDFCTIPKHRTECYFSLAMGLLVSVIFLLYVWPAIAIAVMLWISLRKQAQLRLNGITGDVCGAIIELIETFLLLFAALLV